MKKTILASIFAFTLIYATDSAIELEHAIKTPSSSESPKEDMSKMKAMGKCGADQKAKMIHTHNPSKANKADVELEHAIKTAPSVESPKEDMSKMKAMGKCGGDQKAGKGVEHNHSATPSKSELELEHAIKTPSSEESPKEDMSKMKAMGKCGSGK